MRCFEATGWRAVLLTDSGTYPEGFVDGDNMLTYSSAVQILELIKRLIEDASWASSVAKAAYARVRVVTDKNENGRGSTAMTNVILLFVGRA
jgi:spore maturation protein CgeB